jgi:ABC-type phosphate transport system substrate-binding protein
MIFSKFSSGFLLSLLMLFTSAIHAEVSVIVSANNANASIDADTLSRIFLGKTSNFPDGNQAIPVDQTEGAAARESFNDKVLGKNSSQLKAYWSRLIFTGKGTPPKESGSDADLLGVFYFINDCCNSTIRSNTLSDVK